MKKRWIISLAIMVLVGVLGAFMPEQAGLWEMSDNINTADLAWLITATIFVLMMTHWSVVLLRRHGSKEEHHLDNPAEHHRNGYRVRTLGCGMLQLVVR